MNEHIKAIFEGAELSEDFQSKAQTIFETAVKEGVEAKLNEEREAMTQDLQEKADKYVADVVVPELVGKVDEYLNYVIEAWTKDNKIAIEGGVKVELAESFLKSIKGVCESHSVELPEDKRDLVSEAETKAQEAEAKLNAKIDENVALTAEVLKLKREKIVAQVSEGLTDTQVEKLESVTEGVEFTGDEEGFRAKVEDLKESYFPAEKPEKQELVTEEVDTGAEEQVKTVAVNESDDYYSRLTGALGAKTK